MQLSVYWLGLQATWVPHSGRLDQAMDRQTVFCTSWKASSSSVAQHPMTAPPTGRGGEGDSHTRFLHFSHNSLTL
jgi:hypothetical protein